MDSRLQRTLRRWRCTGGVGPVRHLIEQVEHGCWGWAPVPGAAQRGARLPRCRCTEPADALLPMRNNVVWSPAPCGRPSVSDTRRSRRRTRRADPSWTDARTAVPDAWTTSTRRCRAAGTVVVVLLPGAAALHELHEQFPVAHPLVLLLPRGSSALAFLCLRCMSSAPSSSTSAKADARLECD
jgi:hypothetical protein